MRASLEEMVTYADQSDFAQKISALYHTFKAMLVKDLSPGEFGDVYAQTAIYGLFLARLQSPTAITLADASRLLPSSDKVIQELFRCISSDGSMPNQITWIFQEILNVINHLDLAEMSQTCSFRKSKHDTAKEETDPALYFYETFLGEFAPHQRKAKGVYYTPAPVVSFITRSIDALLATAFGKKTGVADPSVTVLDFAAGAGTFLASIFELTLRKADTAARASLIRDHLLQHVYGFESLAAPYAIAHLTLTQLLKAYGYEIPPDQRVQVYLADTLDDANDEPIPLFPAISKADASAADSNDPPPILVITGNPPYNNRSTGKRLEALMAAYKPEGEKKLNFNDDYLKFIRFAHNMLVVQAKQGIIGVITNNSFLNGLTHRKMRSLLVQDFDEIYILNLHGNTRIGETCPNGRVDQNVFNIMQGVAISLLVRKTPRGEHGKVFYRDLYGKRDEKYRFLSEHDVNSVAWEELQLATFDAEFKRTKWGNTRFKEDFSFFIPTRSVQAMKAYGNFWGITDIFEKSGNGVKTDRDELVIDFDQEALAEKMRIALRGNYDEAFKAQYHIANSSSYNLVDRLKAHQFDVEQIYTIHYRPFDLRKIYYQVGFTSRPAFEIVRNFLSGENVGLVFKRQWKGHGDFSYCFVTNRMAESCLLKSAYANNSVAPLYLYNAQKIWGSKEFRKTPNFTKAFQDFMTGRYPSRTPSPEEILGYIYAVLYAPTYRKTYLEFLKLDFPRVPFVKADNVFNQLAGLGQELVAMHLMKSSVPDETVTFPQAGDDTIANIRFVAAKEAPTGRAYINNTQYFDHIPPNVWAFTIGGYHVLDQWLKARKDRRLSDQEKETFKAIAAILKFTIRQMQRIDDVWNSMMNYT